MCAAPTLPTLATLTAEGLQKAGYTTGNSQYNALLTRAQDYWMQEIKHDIYINPNGIQRKLKSLFKTDYIVFTTGIHKYSNPSDYGNDLSMTLLDGDHTGTATNGGNTSITCASDEDITEDDAIGRYILITSGTGLNSCSQCTAYNETTKEATVAVAWSTNPASGSGYLFVDKTTPLDAQTIEDLDSLTDQTYKEMPLHYYPIGDNDYGEFIVYPTPGQTYGLRRRYYQNLLTLDLAGTLMATLYDKWRNIWIQGVFAKALQAKNDDRVIAEMNLYLQNIERLIATEVYSVEGATMRLAPRMG